MRVVLRFSARAGLASALCAFPALTLAACNILTGVTSLETQEPSPPQVKDASVRDVVAEDAAMAPAPDGSVKVDAGCPAASATSLLGVAKPVAAYFQLTPQTNNVAGGIASPAVVALSDFDASFAYSLTHTAASAPAAGIAFFVIAAPVTSLSCQAGPFLCTLGATAPGFAVILRTSKGAASDPAVPYVAVVDAQVFPGTQPTLRVDVDASKAATTVAVVENDAVPAASTFHRMAIAVRAGKATVSIDGAAVLTSVAIPGYVAGRMSTWGIAGATGQASSFGHRTVVGEITFDRCP